MNHKLSKYRTFRTFSRISLFILLVLTSILFTFCKRTSKGENILGGAYKPASANFYVISTNPKTTFRAYSLASKDTVNTINFSNDSIYFAAKFSESVSWTVTVKGLTSGASKTLNGLSDSVSYTNAVWNGNSDGTRFFIKGESAVATLSFLGSAISLSDTFTIFQVKKYNGIVVNGVIYHLIDDFDGTSLAPLASVTPDLKDLNVSFAADSFHVVNGKYSFRFRGNDANWNSYLGAIATKNLYDYTNAFVNTTDPDKLFFNLYIYGTGTPQTSVALELMENEHNYSASNPFDFSKTDAYICHVPVSWIGWKLVSVPYSQFKKAPDPLSGGNGNGIMEPWLVSGVSLTLESYPTGGKTVDAYVDMVTITEGGPFIP